MLEDLGPANGFAVVVTEDAAAVVVAVRGEVDMATVDELEPVVQDAVARHRAVVVDLCQCQFMDSSGLRLLLNARLRAEEQRSWFGVACTPDHGPARLFELAAPRLLFTFEDRAAAIAAAPATPVVLEPRE